MTSLNSDICTIIASHIYKPKYQLLDWSILSNNLNAIELLTKNQDKIDWFNLSGNPNAIKF